MNRAWIIEEEIRESMAETTKPTVAILTERLNNLISNGKWLVGITVLVLGALFARLLIIGDRIADVQTDVASIKALQLNVLPNIVRDILKGTASPATKSQVENRLALTGTILASAVQGDVPANQQSLKQIGPILERITRDNPDVLAAWQTVGEYINYRSTLATDPFTKKTALQNRLPQCGKNLPYDPGITVSKDRKTVSMHGPVRYVDCVADLDDLNGDGWSKVPGGLIFENCLIRYSGGEIKMTATFKDCLFRFLIQQTPPPSGQKIALALLNDLNTAV